MGRTLYSTGIDTITSDVYDSGRWNLYLCDKVEDLPTEGVRPGFFAIVWATNGFYVANASLEWKRFNPKKLQPVPIKEV